MSCGLGMHADEGDIWEGGQRIVCMVQRSSAVAEFQGSREGAS